ncbi:MAG: transcriptional regulator [Desulfobacteraceae bacterium]|nr:transcriptional regulator [Desulfobacteraceae bacterium]
MNFLLIADHHPGMIPENGTLFDKKKMKTIRQQLIEILSEREMTAIDLSGDVGIGEKEVYEHLPHIARSVALQGKKLVIEPSQCLKCGYVFEGRKRFTRPGRCPQCRETHIQRPKFEIL